VIWESGDGGEPIAFVSEYDPTLILRKASTFLRFDGTLRLAPRPDFALNERADLIITPTEIIALRATSFDRLFSDVRALMNDVPTYVFKLRAALAGLPMTDASAQAFEAVCAKRPSDARRLQRLATNAAHLATLTPDSLLEVLAAREFDPADFLGTSGLEIAEGQVGDFLDLVEGRFFDADFTSERRRAARWSPR
jgi:hypothetical protein